MSVHDGCDNFRRSSYLNVLNLLYRQARLLELDFELKEIASEDMNAPDVLQNKRRRQYYLSAKALRDSVRTEEDDLQWKKVIEIRESLEEYSKTAGVSLGSKSADTRSNT